MTTYDLPFSFPFDSIVYVTILPYNVNGNTVGCDYESFTVGACNGSTTINWGGTTGLWQIVNHWTPNYVPHPCALVEIMSGKATVPSGVTARGKILDVGLGAELEVELGAVLTIGN